MPPKRYRPHFRLIRVRHGKGLFFEDMWYWQCRYCGQVIKPNSAGAQSHLVKHLRDKV